MDICVGIGFIILCFTTLMFVIGLFGYIVHLDKKEFDATPKQASNSNNHEEKI